MTPVCVCGHGFDSHFSMVPIWPPGLSGPSRCMECDCSDRREAAEQQGFAGNGWGSGGAA